MSQDLILISPEKAILTFRIAGLGSRILAHLFDFFILLMLYFGVSILAGIMTIAIRSESLLRSFMLMFPAYAPFLYFILMEGLWNGQTLGKKAVGIRVRMEDGTPITMRGAVTRNLVRIADFIPMTYFAGLVVMFTNPKSQRLGDIVAKTVVLHDRKAVPIFRPAPSRVGYHELEEYVGDLRGMTPEDYVALRAMCDRFYELPVKIQGQMLQEVWKPMESRLEVPSIAGAPPIKVAEAVVMRYGRIHGML